MLSMKGYQGNLICVKCDSLDNSILGWEPCLEETFKPIPEGLYPALCPDCNLKWKYIQSRICFDAFHEFLKSDLLTGDRAEPVRDRERLSERTPSATNGEGDAIV